MSRHLQVLLRSDVPKLGRVGEIVRVRPGFGRNYLLARGLAMPVSPENLRRVEKEKKVRAAEEATRLAAVRALAERVSSATLNIEAKVGEEGRLYGSVTAASIAKAFASLGIPVEEDQIRLEHAIKERGVFPVSIHLHPEVVVETKVWVVEEKGRDAAEPAGP